MDRDPGRSRAVVLVVDDEPAIREVVHLILDDDYDVIEASCGPEALDAVQVRHVDLVVLDVKLPGLDGISVLRQLRLHAPHVAVVMLSAIDTARTAAAAMKLGAVDYLTKPFEDEELREAVELALRAPAPGFRPATGGVVMAGNDRGWRACLAALITATSGQHVTTTALSRISGNCRASLLVLDVVGCGSSRGGVEPGALCRGGSVVIWTDDEVRLPLPATRDDITVVRGRRQIGELLCAIHRHLEPAVDRPPLSTVTAKALHAVADAYAASTVEGVAGVVGLSTRQLARVFHDDTGLTLKAYLLRVRVEAAKALLEDSDATLETIAEEVGLYDASHMGRLFRHLEGVSPGEFRTLRRAMSETS